MSRVCVTISRGVGEGELLGIRPAAASCSAMEIAKAMQMRRRADAPKRTPSRSVKSGSA
ncbi:MAG: hypothetical protein JO263_11495 [Candidatus Eremiobacteraeota bacterium]|nr:hypothetical protein [Candidatus Eremiobacteraeota bacterium]